MNLSEKSGKLDYEVYPQNYDGTLKYRLITEVDPSEFMLNEDGTYWTKTSIQVDILVTNQNETIQYDYFVLSIDLPVQVKGFINYKWYNSDIQILFKHAVLATINQQPLTNGQIIREEGEYFIELVDSLGETTELSFVIDKTPPNFTILPFDTTPTNQPVRVTVQTDEGWKVSHTYESNGSHTFEAFDKAGNRGSITVSIDHIDLLPPEIDGITDGASYKDPVVISFIEGVVTLNGKVIESGTEVSEEGEYVLIAVDSFGNTGETRFTIDKTPPIITINPYIETLTNKSITVIAKKQMKEHLIKVVHTFTENGSFYLCGNG